MVSQKAEICLEKKKNQSEHKYSITFVKKDGTIISDYNLIFDTEIGQFCRDELFFRAKCDSFCRSFANFASSLHILSHSF